jgi:tRNA A37 threonylcarbamoyladenosine biosynthesis protein TsaE
MNGFVNFFLPGKRVLSPTFIIVRNYFINHNGIKNILHADLYRLETGRDVQSLGLAEFLGKPDTIVAIEWAEKMKNDKRSLDFKFKVLDNDLREIHLPDL